MFRWVLLGVLLVAPGCSGDRGSPQLRRTAEELHASGMQAFAERDFARAFDDLGQAAQGGLNADLYAEVLVHHAVAAAHLDRLDVAQQDIEILEQGAPNMGQVLAAKSFIARRLGNAEVAQQYWNQARRIDPKVKQFGK